MTFGGIQKLTLLDYPDKTACTLFTAGCNFRCPYCHNASLVIPSKKDSQIDEEKILRFLGTRKGLLDGVCISGGEPLMHAGLEAFIRRVRNLGFTVKLDTNGSYPDRLCRLLSEGLLSYVAMDLKNTPEKYALTAGVEGFDFAPIGESISTLLRADIPCEFRTTVVRELHSEDDLVAMARLISGAKRYYLQGFTDSGDMLQGGMSAYPSSELKRLLGLVRQILPSAELRGI